MNYLYIMNNYHCSSKIIYLYINMNISIEFFLCTLIIFNPKSLPCPIRCNLLSNSQLCLYLAYYEVINYYVCNHSDVYSCLLDASKDFDPVNCK